MRQSPSNPVTTGLTTRYVGALLFVAALVSGGHVFLLRAFDAWEGDARTINLAGRQRMLSQRIAKAATATLAERSADARRDRLDTIEADLFAMRTVHDGLESGDERLGLPGEVPARTGAPFEAVERPFARIVSGAEAILEARGPIVSGTYDRAAHRRDVERIEAGEREFVRAMDAVVFALDADSNRKLVRLMTIEGTLVAVVLATLAFEGLFVFRPIVRRIGHVIGELRRTESDLRRANAHLASLIEASPVGVVAIDGRGMVSDLSPSAAGMLGLAEGAGTTDLPESVSRRLLDRRSEEIRRRGAGGELRHLKLWRAELRGISDDDSGKLVLIEDITDRRTLEDAIAEASSREQQRIGQDLHDGVGQSIAGASILARTLERKLDGSRPDDAARAAAIAEVLERAVASTRDLSRVLYPVAMDEGGLRSALEELAISTRKTFGLTCRFRSTGDATVEGLGRRLDLYHIAREAVSNALRHGRPRTIDICLVIDEENGTLQVTDDGVGPSSEGARGPGLGLRIMRHRARRIGGRLEAGADGSRGFAVRCSFPLAADGSPSESIRRESAS